MKNAKCLLIVVPVLRVIFHQDTLFRLNGQNNSGVGTDKSNNCSHTKCCRFNIFFRDHTLTPRTNETMKNM